MFNWFKHLTRNLTRLEAMAIVFGIAVISAGSAVAASSEINGSSIRRGTVYLNRLSAGTQNLIRAKPVPGPAGKNGTDGTNGAKGDTGATGPKGDAGGAGTNGTNGATGATGAIGPQGTAGVNGANGANGANGTNGTNGINGAKGDTGDTGATGAKGDTGATGPAGPIGQGATWGTLARNTIGNATAQLRNDSTSPLGTGSLQLTVGSGADKIEFGDETSFAGNPISALTDVGYRVKTTGENNAIAANMPSIAIEVWTSGTVGVGYSTLNYSPTANSTANQWSPYIDAANDPTNAWGLTGSAFNSPATSANCGINGPRCTFAQVKALLTSPPFDAKMISVAVGKGRDYAWNGQVDGLRINATTYDFELSGVKSIPTP